MQELDNLYKAITKRLIDRDFTIKNFKILTNEPYVCCVTIDMDGSEFDISVAKTFLAYHIWNVTPNIQIHGEELQSLCDYFINEFKIYEKKVILEQIKLLEQQLSKTDRLVENKK